jgi:quinohemoprotein ethanol dehydrogenase
VQAHRARMRGDGARAAGPRRARRPSAARAAGAGLAALALLLAPAAASLTEAHRAAPRDTAPARAEPEAGVRPPGFVDDARLAAADAEPGAWLAHGRTWSEQRYSPLAQIHRGNVAELVPLWVYPTGTTRGMEATPLVDGGVMFLTLPWSVVVALDAATGRERWRHDPAVPKAWGRYACCDVVNRGVALYQGRVYAGTLDGRLLALDAATGALVWQVQTTDTAKPYTITGAPRVARGLVVIGNGGAELGVRGYVSAYDAATGALRWRFYTVPASKQGPHEHPELAAAAATWPQESSWESGLGGTAWDSMAYDPELDLLYVGVGNSAPYARRARSPGGGDNLFLASILALRPETGRLVWHYQTTPGEGWDYTATQHMILAELEIEGRKRRVLMQAPKNGFFYVLDRETGELLSAEKYTSVSWASHVDLASGRPVETGRAAWDEGAAMVIPGPSGGHNWHPMAWSPRTGLVYVPTLEMPYPYVADPAHVHVEGTFNTGEDFPALARRLDGFERALRFCAPAGLTAWDPVAQRAVWRVAHRSEVNGGALATAGGLVFQGSGDGALVAYRDIDGARLWSSPVGIAIMAPPISYESAGRQIVAVAVGMGGSAGLNFATFDYQNAGYVIAYALGGEAALPEVRRRPPGRVDVPPRDDAPETIARGQALYSRHCMRCHGIGTKSGGLLPDLRHSTRDVHDQWRDIVLSGTRAERGMASFADLLTAEDADAIHAYVVSQALRAPTLVERTAERLSKRLCVPGRWVAD